MRIPGRIWRVVHYVQNIWWDGRATLAGYCNHCPNDGTPGSGGYTFWRCARRRQHEGLHRAANYVWTDDGMTEYQPVPYGRPQGARQPYRRTVAMTRRQRRNRDAWHRQKDAERRARHV